MASYTKDTGASGTMKIVDTGTRVEFWLRANSSTYNYQLPYGYTVNGTTDNSNSFRFEKGGDWQMLRSWAVSTSQTVYFRLQDSGTNSLGGPTTFSVAIKRATYPDPPTKPVVSSITASSVYVTFSDGDNNGDAIDGRQIQYGTTSPTNIVSSDRSTTITGLKSGTQYYFRARTHNSEGYSAWTSYTGAKTLDEPAAPGVVQISSIKQTSVRARFSDPSDTGGAAILERQIGYGVTNGTPTTTVKYAPNTGGTAAEQALNLALGISITNLAPGTTYYFRSRTRNSVGWSAWSAATAATTWAGGYVKVGGVWKTAVPYVKVGGVWKLARPMGRIFGYWEEP